MAAIAELVRPIGIAIHSFLQILHAMQDMHDDASVQLMPWMHQKSSGNLRIASWRLSSGHCSAISREVFEGEVRRECSHCSCLVAAKMNLGCTVRCMSRPAKRVAMLMGLFIKSRLSWQSTARSCSTTVRIRMHVCLCILATTQFGPRQLCINLQS